MDYKKIILGGVLALSLGGNLVATLDKEPESVIVKEPEPILVWEKPTSDKEWLEDTKKEGLDTRSNKELSEMLVSHKEKLEREVKDLVKYTDCPECVYFEISQSLSNSMGLEGKELEKEAELQTQDTIRNRLLSVEKLKQSIERMEKEIELRK